jgi:hypothetical protein
MKPFLLTIVLLIIVGCSSHTYHRVGDLYLDETGVVCGKLYPSYGGGWIAAYTYHDGRSFQVELGTRQRAKIEIEKDLQ